MAGTRQGRIRRGCDLFHPQSGRRPSRRFRFPSVVGSPVVAVSGGVFSEGEISMLCGCFFCPLPSRLTPPQSGNLWEGTSRQLGGGGPCASLCRLRRQIPAMRSGEVGGRPLADPCDPRACPGPAPESPLLRWRTRRCPTPVSTRWGLWMRRGGPAGCASSRLGKTGGTLSRTGGTCVGRSHAQPCLRGLHCVLCVSGLVANRVVRFALPCVCACVLSVPEGAFRAALLRPLEGSRAGSGPGWNAATIGNFPASPEGTRRRELSGASEKRRAASRDNLRRLFPNCPLLPSLLSWAVR